MDLSALGITPADLREQIINKAVSRLFEESEEGVGMDLHELLENAIKTRAKEAIDAMVDNLASETVVPKVEAMIESMTFQKTSQWGEPKEPAKTWRELLVERAENWLAEPVNYEGKTQGEYRSSGWSKSNTRVMHLVDSHLKYEINVALQSALKDLNSKVAGGLVAAVKISLNEQLAKLGVNVTLEG